MNCLLELDGVAKSFGGVTAVRDFSLSIQEGEVVGLIGPNGAGKTTLFNLISGFLDADSGRITFGGTDLGRLKPHQRASLGISRTFQIARPFPRMSVTENVMAGAIFGRGSRRLRGLGALEEARELLGLVSLVEKADARAGSLTLAEQRRLELARALATNPKLLMLDEVMAGLSPGERAVMVELLRRAGKERSLTMVISEHVIDVLASLCSRLVVMDRGLKLVEGETGPVLGSDVVGEAYLGAPRRAGKGARPQATDAEKGG